MIKLEDLKTSEIECVINLIDYQIITNDVLINGIFTTLFGESDLEAVKKEQALLKSFKSKLEKMKGKVLYTYD